MANNSQLVISKKIAVIILIANCLILYLLSSGHKEQCVVINQISKIRNDKLVSVNDPIIYGITPTYARGEQKAELTR